MAQARSGIVVAVLVMGLVTVAPATAKPRPAAKCLSAKFRAAAKRTAAKLACQAKAAQQAKPVAPACLGKAEAAFGKAFTNAESKGACPTTGTASAVEASVDGFVESVVAALPGGGTKDGGKCAGAKRKASGKYAAAELLCQAKAALKAVAVDPECIEKGESAFVKAFGKAEGKGGCATMGDGGVLDETIDEFVDDVVAALAPATTTTPTTPSATSTTMGGGSTVQVKVGEGGLVFVPATKTVKVGATVRWTWSSSGHSVVSGTPGSPDGKFCSPRNTNCGSTPSSSVNAVYEHTFTTAGSYPYYCLPHGDSGMVGKIVVEP